MRYILMTVLLFCIGGCRGTILFPMNSTKPIVVNKLHVDKEFSYNPRIVTSTFISKIQNGLTDTIKYKMPLIYNVQLNNECDKNSLELTGHLMEINLDASFRMNPISHISYKDMTTFIAVKGEVVECDSRNVIREFQLTAYDNNIDRLIDSLADGVLQEFETISMKRPRANL